MDIVARIVKMAEERNVTGVEIGCLLGLKKSPLTDWKNGKSKPTLEQVLSICENFAISADYLLLGKVQSDYTPTSDMRADEQELLDCYRKLDRRGHHRLLTFAYEELDRKESAEVPLRPIPFAASGEADITPENYADIQARLQKYDKRAKELEGK